MMRSLNDTINVGYRLNFLERLITSILLIGVAILAYRERAVFRLICWWLAFTSYLELFYYPRYRPIFLRSLFWAYIGLGIASACYLFEVNKAYLVIAISISAVNDSAAYVFGKLIGGPKLWPRITPNKTVSGFIAGIAMSAFVADRVTLFTGSALRASISARLAYLVMAIACVMGGMFSSKIKRIMKVSSYSEILPGHGGVIDRIDGTCAACILMIVFRFLI